MSLHGCRFYISKKVKNSSRLKENIIKEKGKITNRSYTKGDFHVLSKLSFQNEDKEFVNYHNRELNVIGDQYLKDSIKKDVKIMFKDNPIFSTIMEGVCISFSEHFEEEIIDEYAKLITFMSGEVYDTTSFPDEVTHFITISSNCPKYKYAVSRDNVHIVHPDWISQCWNLGMLVPEENHSTLFFSGIKLVVTGGDRHIRDKIEQQTEKYGGIYSPDYDNTATHLLVFTVGTNKHKAAIRSRNVYILNPQWFDDCIQRRALLYVNNYFINGGGGGGGGGGGTGEHLQDYSELVASDSSQYDRLSQGKTKGRDVQMKGRYDDDMDEKKEEEELYNEDTENFRRLRRRSVLNKKTSGGRGGGRTKTVVVGRSDSLDFNKADNRLIQTARGVKRRKKSNIASSVDGVESLINTKNLFENSDVQFEADTSSSQDPRTDDINIFSKEQIKGRGKEEGDDNEEIEEPYDKTILFKQRYFVCVDTMETKQAEEIEELISNYGGTIGEEASTNSQATIVTHIICPHGHTPPHKDMRYSNCTVITPEWIHCCIENERIVDINECSILFTPLSHKPPFECFRGTKITVSGFQYEEREFLVRLIKLLGFKFSAKFFIKSTQYLVVSSPNGEKFEVAKKQKSTFIVSKDWVHQCAKQRQLAEERNYLMGPLPINRKKKKETIVQTIKRERENFSSSKNFGLQQSNSNLGIIKNEKKKYYSTSREDFNNNEPCSPILPGVVIYVNRRNDKLREEITRLHDQVTTLGGSFVTKFDTSITHFIHDGRDDHTREHREAKRNKNIHIVSPHWIYQCYEDNKRHQERDFPPSFNPRQCLNIFAPLKHKSQIRSTLKLETNLDKQPLHVLSTSKDHQFSSGSSSAGSIDHHWNSPSTNATSTSSLSSSSSLLSSTRTYSSLMRTNPTGSSSSLLLHQNTYHNINNHPLEQLHSATSVISDNYNMKETKKGKGNNGIEEKEEEEEGEKERQLLSEDTEEPSQPMFAPLIADLVEKMKVNMNNSHTSSLRNRKRSNEYYLGREQSVPHILDLKPMARRIRRSELLHDDTLSQNPIKLVHITSPHHYNNNNNNNNNKDIDRNEHNISFDSGREDEYSIDSQVVTYRNRDEYNILQILLKEEQEGGDTNEEDESTSIAAFESEMARMKALRENKHHTLPLPVQRAMSKRHNSSGSRGGSRHSSNGERENNNTNVKSSNTNREISNKKKKKKKNNTTTKKSSTTSKRRTRSSTIATIPSTRSLRGVKKQPALAKNKREKISIPKSKRRKYNADRMVFSFTQIASLQQKTNLMAIANDLGAKADPADRLNAKGTHLILGEPRIPFRINYKILLALSKQQWILKPSFLLSSKKNGYMVAEEDHEWTLEDIKNKDSMFRALGQARVWREYGFHNKRKPYRGWVVVIISPRNKHSTLKRITQCGGSNVALVSTDYPKTYPPNTTHILTANSDPPSPNDVPDGIQVFSEDMLIEFLANGPSK